MRVLGIDPGIGRMGFALIEVSPASYSNFSLLNCGVIQTSKDLHDAFRLKEIREDLFAIIDAHKPEFIAVEKLFFFKNPKTIIPVAEARGVVLELAASSGLKIFEYTPLEVKKNITGHGMSPKQDVSKIIHQILNLEKPITQDDAVDAIAIAITALRVSLQQAL